LFVVGGVFSPPPFSIPSGKLSSMFVGAFFLAAFSLPPHCLRPPPFSFTLARIPPCSFSQVFWFSHRSRSPTRSFFVTFKPGPLASFPVNCRLFSFSQFIFKFGDARMWQFSVCILMLSYSPPVFTDVPHPFTPRVFTDRVFFFCRVLVLIFGHLLLFFLVSTLAPRPPR